MADDGKLRDAARIALNDVLAVKEGERVLIVTNLGGDVFEISQECFRQAQAIKARPVMVVQEEKDAFCFADPAVLDAIRGEPDIVISICRGRIGKDPQGMHVGYVGRDGKKYRHIWDKLQEGDKRTRAFWSPGCTREIFERSIAIDYEELRGRARVLKGLIDDGSEIRVTSPGGTDVTISIVGRKGQYDDGDFRLPGSGGNLPTGEVYVSPANGTTEGVIVFDGTVDLDVKAVSPDVPVRVRFEKGFATEITGGRTADELSKLLDMSAKQARDEGLMEEARNTRHLGELGIGLNPKAKMSCNILEDEKVGRTVHFAIGMNLDHDAHALIHLDSLVLRPDLYIDGKRIMREGDLEIF